MLYVAGGALAASFVAMALGMYAIYSVERARGPIMTICLDSMEIRLPRP
jgi:hypothetical protein